MRKRHGFQGSDGDLRLQRCIELFDEFPSRRGHVRKPSDSITEQIRTGDADVRHFHIRLAGRKPKIDEANMPRGMAFLPRRDGQDVFRKRGFGNPDKGLYLGGVPLFLCSDLMGIRF